VNHLNGYSCVCSPGWTGNGTDCGQSSISSVPKVEKHTGVGVSNELLIVSGVGVVLAITIGSILPYE
jgi:hypothetical protein